MSEQEAHGAVLLFLSSSWDQTSKSQKGSLLTGGLQSFFSAVSKPLEMACLEASPAVTCEIQHITDIQNAQERHTPKRCSVYSVEIRNGSCYLPIGTPPALYVPLSMAGRGAPRIMDKNKRYKYGMKGMPKASELLPTKPLQSPVFNPVLFPYATGVDFLFPVGPTNHLKLPGRALFVSFSSLSGGFHAQALKLL